QRKCRADVRRIQIEICVDGNECVAPRESGVPDRHPKFVALHSQSISAGTAPRPLPFRAEGALLSSRAIMLPSKSNSSLSLAKFNQKVGSIGRLARRRSGRRAQFFD